MFGSTKTTVGVLVAGVLALGAGNVNLTPSIFDYPLLADEDIEKLEWVYHAEEVLRLEHNEMGRQYREGIITEAQWNEYLALSFNEKSKWLGYEKATLRNNLGYSTMDTEATSSKAELKRQSDEKDAFKKSTRWDIKTDVIFVKNRAEASVEDFSTYTEVDPGTKISITSTKITVTTMLDSDDARVYKDFGAGYFSADFEHLITVYQNSSTVTGLGNIVWGVSNITTAEVVAEGTQGIYVRMYEETAGTASLFIRDHNGANSASDNNTALSLNTPYYLKIKRDEAIGTYGTAYVYIYSDSGRTTLVDTLTITLSASSKLDYRYVYAYAGWGSEAGSYSWTGYTENLDLQEVVPNTYVRTEGLIDFSDQ